jgi:hypothetical protein
MVNKKAAKIGQKFTSGYKASILRIQNKER